MRYPASEKAEIIGLVEQSHLPVKRTLDTLGIPRTTFYRWYDQYQTGGVEALEDRSPKPGRVWNRIPDDVRDKIVDLALEEPELSPRELAVRFTDTQGYFVSEASVYRLLKALDLITSPAFVVIKAADEFTDKTTAPNQMWQTDFTYLKVIGWGWFYLSTILDDFSRYIIAWKLCTTMRVEDVTETLEAALATGPYWAVISNLSGKTSDGQYVDGVGNINAIDAAQTAGVERFILVSTIGAGESVNAVPINVREILGHIFEMKDRAEERLILTNMNYTIIRPGGLYDGPPNGNGLMTEDTKMYGRIARGEVARLTVQALNDDATIGKVYSVIDAKPEN